jgi:hypothetical protein
LHHLLQVSSPDYCSHDADKYAASTIARWLLSDVIAARSYALIMPDGPIICRLGESQLYSAGMKPNSIE